MKAHPIALFLAALLGPTESTSAQPTAATGTVTACSLARPDLILHYTDRGAGEPVLVLMGGPGVTSARHFLRSP